ncbi:MAG: hypothetical protein Q8L24_01370, partial [bacterium]|nr:hypothetical protein [bacterium]
MRYYVYTIIGIVTAIIVAGFFIVGSPLSARLLQQDNQRVSDLQMVQSEILNFWMNKARLPKILSELEDDIRGIRIPKDPVTGVAYTYTATSPQSFTLCATFAKPSAGNVSTTRKTTAPVPAPAYSYSIPYGQENWQHNEGLVCF